MISCTDSIGRPSGVKEGEFDLKIKWIRGYFGALTASPLRPPPKSPIKDGKLVTSGPLVRRGASHGEEGYEEQEEGGGYEEEEGGYYEAD